MNHQEPKELPSDLLKGRETLKAASKLYGRTLSAEECWWLGVGLAATTLAELADRPYTVGRLEQLMERLGQAGTQGDWLQRLVEELAEMDAEGLLWPVYSRSQQGPVVRTGVQVCAAFDTDAGYLLALAHIAVALAVHRQEQDTVSSLAAVIGGLVQEGLSPQHEATILAALQNQPQ